VGMERGGKRLFRGLNLEFEGGTCTGIIGRNGLGKTTLLNILQGKLQPDEGSVTIGERTQFNYADQNRLVMDGSKNMLEEVGAGSDTVQFGSERLHIRSYLKRFLFTDETLHSRIDALSGGEQNRVMLAKILRYGGNFLILDEPTNDLDLATLRVLEEAILSFPGVVLVVSHDRFFLDRVADRTIAFEGDGRVIIQEGNYSYYVEKRREQLSRVATQAAPVAAPAKERAKAERPRKLSWKEERELEGIEPEILRVEERIAEIETAFADPDFYKQHAEADALTKEQVELKSKLETLYARWDELEQIRAASKA